MKTQKYWPNDTILPGHELYLLLDHMPTVDLSGCHNSTYQELAQNLFGKNSYIDQFSAAGIDQEKNFFVFGTYMQLAQCTGRDNMLFLPAWPFYLVSLESNQKPNTIDFGKKTIDFNCQMHNQRYNRILASCWLYNNQHQLNFEYTQSWQSEEKTALLFELMKLGNLATWEGSQYAIKNLDKKYILSDIIGIELYFNSLQYRNMFANSAVSVLLATTFFEHGSDVDEKFLTAMYAGTIPLNDGYMFSDTIKKLGFDNFEDIVDTSYQYEKNPCVRTWSMLEKNRHLLEHGLDYIQRLDIQERILANYNLVKTPDAWAAAAFSNLNTAAAQLLYLEKYQDHVINSVPGWPVIEL